MNIFVIVTSDPCGHCKTFKAQHFNNLIDNLSKINDLVILNANFPEMKTNGYFSGNGNPKKNVFQWINKKDLKINVNPKLESLITGFPQFFLFSVANWGSGTELNGLIPNGTIVNGKIVPSNSGPMIARTSEALTEWIKNGIIELNKNGNAVKNKDTGSGNSKNQSYMPTYIEPSKFKIKINPQPDE